MTFDRFIKNLNIPFDINSSAKLGKRLPKELDDLPIKSDPTVKSSDTDYLTNIKNAYKNGGIKALLEYLNQLPKGVVSNINSEQDAKNGTWTLKFTINGKNYTFLERWTPEKSGGTTPTPTVQTTPSVSTSGQEDDYDSTLKRIAEEGGAEGLIEYLNSLDKGTVTYLNSTTNQQYDSRNNLISEITYVVFTLNGKNYTISIGTYSQGPNKDPITYVNELDSSRVPYETIINDIYAKDGMSGVVEYLDTLNHGSYYTQKNLDTGTLILMINVTSRSIRIDEKLSADNANDSGQVDLSGDKSQPVILNEIFNKRGIQGLLDYFETLEKGTVTNIQIGTDFEHGEWSLCFTINEKSYVFKEHGDTWGWDIQPAASNYDKVDYDMNNYKGNTYFLGGDDEKANLEKLEKDLEQCLKEQFRETFMPYYTGYLMVDHDFEGDFKRPELNAESLGLIFESDFSEALRLTLGNLPITYVTNENGEEVPCVNFEDVVAEFRKNFLLYCCNRSASLNNRTVPQANGQNNHTNETVAYKQQFYYFNDVRDLEVKRKTMKDSLMALRDKYAKVYANALGIKNMDAFNKIFEECVDAALDKVIDMRSAELINNDSMVEINGFSMTSTSELVGYLNEILGERLDRDTINSLK